MECSQRRVYAYDIFEGSHRALAREGNKGWFDRFEDQSMSPGWLARLND
jgi:hypothetical protein